MKKRIFAGVLMLTMAAVIAGCGDKKTAENKTTEEKTTEEVTETTEKTTEKATEQTEDQGQTNFGAAVIYKPDDQAEDLESQRVKVEGMNEKSLLQALKDAEVLKKDIKILSYEKKDKKIAVDFNEAFGTYFKQMGSAEEHLKMQAVAKTFCKNLGADSFSFTVEGEVLETGHQVYEEPIGVK